MRGAVGRFFSIQMFIPKWCGITNICTSLECLQKKNIGNLDMSTVLLLMSSVWLKSGLDKLGVQTPGTTRKRFWVTRIRGLVAQCTIKFFF